MKKLLTSLFLALFIMTSFVGVNALEGSMRSVDEIVSEIKTDLGITINDTIDVNLVDETLLEELGDSVMEVYIGNSEQHEILDEYYGGDDSETLSALHIQIGEDYLNGVPITMMTFMQYGTNDQSNYYGPMMRGYQNDGYNTNQAYGGMMGRNYQVDRRDNNYTYAPYYRDNGMMNFGSGGMIMGFIGFLIVVGAVVYIVSTNNRNQVYPTNTNNAMNILKERYARGEITREEFLQISSTIK